MKITRISAWKVELPIDHGGFRWSGGGLRAFDSTVVRIETDEGITGWGEVCPLGPTYLPAYGEGVRAGIRQMAPSLVGSDPTRLSVVNARMDAALKGHPYVKSGIDIACWDILGKVAGLPVCSLLGGKHGDAVLLHRAISQDAAATMAAGVSDFRAQGYRRFQLKLGGRPQEDVDRIQQVVAVLEPGDTLIGDANGAWLMHEAAQVLPAMQEVSALVSTYLEQPCRTYEECLSIRRRTALPFILDESIDAVGPLVRAYGDAAMDAVNLKISKLGGLTRAARARDLCVELGVAMIIEDSSGGDVATAAVTHLAHSTPEGCRFASTDLNGYVTRKYAEGAPLREDGRLMASDAPGLGVAPYLEELGQPSIEIE